MVHPGTGGAGGAAEAKGKEGDPGKKGGDARATGGKGADNKKKLSVFGTVAGTSNVEFGDAVGGEGGPATAEGGKGGDANECGMTGGALDASCNSFPPSCVRLCSSSITTVVNLSQHTLHVPDPLEITY